ncbi:galectin-4 isoform X1 [Episyrphus balteatus]|uniref:galectin-4 isoform X1 n=1 Tax=Episyrphus balteatus TaxID=286459 RepID=UPI002486601D|nr:galectin-4 isoform X1 [Episyrphus balteatus]
MSRPFIAIIPQSINDGDKVLLKGLVKDNANEFSINFATGTGPNPEDIAYHFKTIFPENIVVENSKRNGDWMDEQIKEWPASDGPLKVHLALNYSHFPNNKDNPKSSSISGPGFALEFAFTSGYVYTYLVEDEHSRNLISFYEHDYDLNEINSVQVWGDVEKIQELTFRYS